MKKIAIIDLGTNTFNLLIVSVNGDKSYQIIHNGKLAVKLGEGGINQNYIAPIAYQRGINAIGEHFRTILLHGASEIFAFATSALRNASNGQDFVNEIKNLFGVEVRLINGDEEAELIYLGIRQAVPLNEENVLILDIGGGSNELIIGNSKKFMWRRSYDLGISRLLQKFKPSDPISLNQIEEVERYIEFELADLVEPLGLYQPKILVGSSGSFDTYRSILTATNIITPNGDPSIEIPLDEYFKLHNRLILTTIDQRTAISGMDPMRVEMIVLATVFTHFLIRKFGITRMIQSAYSLKEGAVWKVINSGTTSHLAN
jgi:exopolyphosphatase/guanosine-5'-triphosphate,3'-diphosphate pyrophosphatase